MATNQIRNLLNRIDRDMFSVKDKIRKEQDKNLGKIKERIPNKEKLKNTLISNACSNAAQDKMKKVYDRLHDTIDKLENLAGRGKDSISKLQAKIKRIKDIILPKIQSVLEFLKNVIVPILIVAIIIAEIILNLPARYTTGRFITFLADKIKKAKTKIKEYLNLSKTIIKVIPLYIAKAMAVLLSIEIAKKLLEGMISFIKKMKAFLEYLYLKYIKECTVSNQTPVDSSGNINEDILVDNLTNTDMGGIVDTMTTLYNDLLVDLQEQGKTQIIERLIDTKFDFRTSYEVKTVSIV